jgi:hypothetical protein
MGSVACQSLCGGGRKGEEEADKYEESTNLAKGEMIRRSSRTELERKAESEEKAEETKQANIKNTESKFKELTASIISEQHTRVN